MRAGRWLGKRLRAGLVLPILFSCAFAAPALADTILFVGNSFTMGAGSPVEQYRPTSVTDLNDGGTGGVPALFKRFTEQAGLDWKVALETAGGRTLRWHFENKSAAVDRGWDHVVLQEYSTLDPERPGDAAQFARYAMRMATLARRDRPATRVWLTSTWSRPDLTYAKDSPWRGKPITAMALDLRSAYDRVAAQPEFAGVIPVGQAFNRAVETGLADPNPYDGISAGQIDLWASDHYHGSTAGYYLEALTVFGRVTGIDPTRLGRDEAAAADLGIAPEQAARLQAIASAQLAEERQR